MTLLGRAFGMLSLVAATVGMSQSFTVSATPGSVTIHPGDQNVPVTVSVSNSSTYSGPVVVTLTGLPSGISVTPVTLIPGGSGTVYLSATVAADQEDFPNTEILSPASAVHTVTVEGLGGALSATSTLQLTVSLANPTFAPSSSQINLPIVTINTSGTPITSTTTDVPGTITITSADGETPYLPNSSDSDNTATFHVHGHSIAAMPKLPYEMKLNTSLDLLNTMGLSCPYVTSSGKAACDKSKTYILLANYDDKSLLRDWTASALANAIPLTTPYLTSPAGSPSPSGTSVLMPWAPHSLFVELYLNGVYEGNYQLIEKVNVDSHRINITELSDKDTTDVTGGYLLEIDQHGDEDYVFVTPQNVPIGMIDPDFTPEVSQQTAYINSYVDDAETALFSSNFTSPTQGWPAYFDEASAVNFYIVNDLMGNNDGGAFFSSDYLYKDVDNPLIYMGPIWDFDISSGNVNYNPIVNPTVPWMQVEATWYAQWFKDPKFKADVVTQWNLLKSNGVFAAWLASIPQEAATLQQSQANNFARWPMLGIEVWPNSEAVGSYDGEVRYLVEWLKLRMAWLDSQFNGKEMTTTTFSPSTGTLRNGTAATLTAQVAAQAGGGTTPTGTVSFLSNSILLGVGRLDSSGTASLTTTGLPAGTDLLQAVFSGDSTNGMSASTSQQLTVLGPLVNTVSSLASSVPALTDDGDGDADDTVTFTASVLGLSTTTTAPTGTLTFVANGTSLGTASLSPAGTATFPTANLPIATDSVQAIYSGDSTYAGSSSNAVTVDVTMPPPNFALTISPSTMSVPRGHSATFSLTVTPKYGFTEMVSFTCSGVPSGEACSFSPATVTPSGAPVISTLTIARVLEADAPGSRPRVPLWAKMGGGFTLALVLWPWRRRRSLFAGIVLLGIGLALSGCGGSSSTATVTIVASGGSITQVQTVNLGITP